MLFLPCIHFLLLIIAGTCWVKRMEGGKCKHPISRHVTKADCCAAGPDVGFTEKEMSEYEYFFATAVGEGTSCSSCIGKYKMYVQICNC